MTRLELHKVLLVLESKVLEIGNMYLPHLVILKKNLKMSVYVAL